MSVISTQISVTRCVECPFFERGVGSFLADRLLKSSTKSGTCKFHGCGQPFPFGRVNVPDETTVPPNCPLRSGQVLIQLGKEPS